MTLRLEHLLTRIRALANQADVRQDRIAERLGLELDRLLEASDDAPAPTPEAVSRQWLGGQEPTPDEVHRAVRSLRAERSRNTLGPDLSIRSMIDEGRL